MTERLPNMIFDLIRIIESEIGHPLPGTSAARVQAAFCATYGGERVYVPHLPKRQNAVKLLGIGSHIAPAEAARRLGVTQRYVRKLSSGK